jgi:adenosylcobyric acid synthase
MPTTPRAKALMIQGTSSSVGKSVMTAALCRILAQNGVKVAPFKAQNMSNNSYVAADGGEMGRAQVVQAQAAGIEPHTDMNPVLLKPEADSRSQVVINGKPIGSFEARKYWGDQSELWKAVSEAYDRLAAQYDVIVLEGAGSPAEVNLRDRDIVNMRMAAYANASVILVGDIDRGGVFASLLGTIELLLPEERALVKATLINRFRGDIALLNPLPEMIAERTGVPVAGVIPFLHDLQVKDEDGVTFADYNPSIPMGTQQSSLLREGARGRVDCSSRPSRPTTPGADDPPSQSGRELEGGRTATRDQVVRRRPELNATPGAITIGVVGLPRVSNHDDLDPFRRAGCRIRIVTSPSELETAHIIIIPGSKSTIADLRWMKSRKLDQAIIEAANRNVTIVGICGGYQILGEHLNDPNATESPEAQSERGLGLLPTSTTFHTAKTTRRVTIEIPTHKTGPVQGESAHGTGYEIHTGITTNTENHLANLNDDLPPNPFFPREKARLRGNEDSARDSRNDAKDKCHPEALEGRQASQQRLVSRTTRLDGAIATNLPVIGTYVHGFFDSPEILRRLLNATAETHNLPQPTIEEFSMEAEYDRLADHVRKNIDMTLINSLITDH